MTITLLLSNLKLNLFILPLAYTTHLTNLVHTDFSIGYRDALDILRVSVNIILLLLQPNGGINISKAQ